MINSDKQYKRILAIGDIHGCFTPFKAMYDSIDVTDDDLVIFLGDYIDRGRESLRTLFWIIEESKRDNVIALRGNHDQTLLDCIAGPYARFFYSNNSGIGTVREVREAMKNDRALPLKIAQAIRHMPIYHHMMINGREYIFCHAGIDPKLPLEAQPQENFYWVREEFYNAYEGDAMFVIGHTPVQFLKKPPVPYKVEDRNILMIDTGSCCVDGGRISCIDVLSGRIWQTNAISSWGSMLF